MKFKILFFLLSTLISQISAAQEVVFYVSSRGNDKASGRSARDAFATLKQAQIAVRTEKIKGYPKTGFKVWIRGGEYELKEPLVFGPEDSGTEQMPVIYQAMPGERVRISGGEKITGWKKTQNGLWKTTLPKEKAGQWYFHQIWVNGQNRRRAHTPNTGFYTVKGFPDGGAEVSYDKGSQRFEFGKGDIDPNWTNLNDVEAIVYHFWTDSHLRVQSVDETADIVTFKHKTGKRFTDDYTKDGARYIIENVFEALDAPGEWYLNRVTGVLSYMPMPGEDMTKAEVIAPVIPQLMVLNGDPISQQYVEHLHFKNIRFEHTNFILPDGDVNNNQGSAGVSAAFKLKGVRNSSFENCRINNIGNFAFDLDKGCSYNLFSGNRLTRLAAGGFRINGGNAESPPLERTGFNEFRNNVISHFGEIYPSAVGILLMHTNGNLISHNLIHHGFYTGISVGWSWGYQPSVSRDNIVEFNHIHDIGQGLLSDMGAIYTLGLSPGTVIRNNLIHDVESHGYGGWGIYMDEGTSHLLVENNVVYNTKFAAFNIHYSKEITVRNNIFALSRLSLLSRSVSEPHKSVFFTNNIMYWTEGMLFDGDWTDKAYPFYLTPADRKRPKELADTFDMDYNIFFNPGMPVDSVEFGKQDLLQWRARGKDVHSVYTDPLFEDAAKFNFRLKAGSPAFKVGFKQIEMQNVGPASR
ncbi:right-handed parallel beta-helix repeat-containing protein [Dyadobacter psychrotolerans]|uniref:Right-handed parallel beta-helix repeat-containing protein n=1 Tax=Dyadobacter psychrotolerans TaxID=2541721 RepID=A0A4V2Z3K4_9BACT|nr:right-handed parallel beta-helix repeat-containing protein [Dyadobacter psychrotolerans]TDE12928.1 right-handed parallel beta-helix repeat-containing protein [Dyadobacter psychrotolerans]